MSLSTTWTDEAQDTFQQIITLIEDKMGNGPGSKICTKRTKNNPADSNPALSV